MDEPVKYVCKYGDLDKLLDDELKGKFQALFADSWRMKYVHTEPGDDAQPERKEERQNRKFAEFFEQLGINYASPTVRDAVAFDLVKLDDDSVSNDSLYTYGEHLLYSPSEYERWLLNRNYRVNLVNLAEDWSDITYAKSETSDKRRTMDKRFEGIRLSPTLMDYFVNVMENGNGVYVPFTNANDFSAEVSIIPNTHDNLRQITSRAYYDTKWAQYKWLLNQHGIANIATFALVDPNKDKNHTGEYLVKVQRRVGDNWQYLTVVMDKDGHLKSEPVVWTTDGNPEDLSVGNTILCVCEQDFDKDRTVPETRETWETQTGDIPMVHSTTSSHYSVFRQRIPDYDLKLVRHWFQFKNRLGGMELCLEQLKRDVNHKETEVSECFTKQTMVLQRLMSSFADNQDVMDLVAKYYDLLAEWDDLMLKKLQLEEYKDGKLALLRQLQDEYNALKNSQMDKKLALGQKIASLRLELDKSVEESLKSIVERLDEIEEQMNAINEQIRKLEADKQKPYEVPDEYKEILEGIDEQTIDSATSLILEWAEDNMLPDSTESRLPVLVQEAPCRRSVRRDKKEPNEVELERKPPDLIPIETRELQKLVLQSERWRNYILNLSWEWEQMKKMQTMCDDATIKVRRLCHNFEERMKDTQEQVWDENYNLKPDFDFKNISVAGLRSVILLHDWWAANAPNAKPEDLHMTDEEFKAFRKRCNTISYNLRKNQYAQLLATKIERAQRRISELEDIIADKDTLHWDDKYGADAPSDEGEEAWTPEMAKAASKAKVRLFAMADAVIDAQPRSAAKSGRKSPTSAIRSGLAKATAALSAKEREQKQYREDSRKLVERTMDYLKSLGLVKNQADLESIATRNVAQSSPVVASRWIAELTAQREKLDGTIDLMNRQRDSLKGILDNAAKIEGKIRELKERNHRIYEQCMKAGPKTKGVQRNVRNRMLLEKVENEEKLIELRATLKKVKGKHLDDFSSLEKMRRDVDSAQESYDAKVREFKKDIGLTKEVVDNLMVGIYNKFQDEILEHDNKRKQK